MRRRMRPAGTKRRGVVDPMPAARSPGPQGSGREPCPRGAHAEKLGNRKGQHLGSRQDTWLEERETYREPPESTGYRVLVKSWLQFKTRIREPRATTKHYELGLRAEVLDLGFVSFPDAYHQRKSHSGWQKTRGASDGSRAERLDNQEKQLQRLN